MSHPVPTLEYEDIEERGDDSGKYENLDQPDFEQIATVDSHRTHGWTADCKECLAIGDPDADEGWGQAQMRRTR